MIWALIALVSIAVAAALALPLLRARAEAAPRVEFDLAVYRDQLTELDRDHARGLLSDAERDAARLEVERRMLAAAAEPSSAPAAPAPHSSWRAALALVAPVLAVGLYLTVGAPSLGLRSSAENAERAQRAEIARYIDRLANHVKDEPNDARGWSMLGRSYTLLSRFDEAIDAYQHAEALAPHDSDLLSRHAEARVMADGGTVGAEAKTLVERALALDPQDPRARFYQALAEDQAGHGREALDLWLALEADTPPDAAWRPVVAARIEAQARALGLDPTKLPRRVPRATAEAPAAPGRAAPEGMSGEDQAKMIRGMVEGLAARLAENPNDADGWARLGRSYAVLGEREKARDAWRHAAELKPRDASTLAEYASAILALTGDDAPPPEFTATAAALLRLAPDNPDALWFAGVAAQARGDKDSAAKFWTALLEQLPAESPARDEVTRALARLK